MRNNNIVHVCKWDASDHNFRPANESARPTGRIRRPRDVGRAVNLPAVEVD